MKDLGTARSCLGMRINQHEHGIDLDQSTYIADVLKRFAMADCKPIGMPSDTSTKLSVTMITDKSDITGKVPFQEAVGSLLHLTQGTRPDIAFAVNDVSRFNAKHSIEHWQAVKRIMRYLKGTIDYKLRFRTSENMNLHVYTDADWASDIDKRRSCSGFVAIMANAAISWHSHRQEIVALSSTEAEYIALSSAVREVIWLRQVQREIDKIEQPTKIYCDNSSTIKLTDSEAYRQRTKHIDVRFHHTRKMVDEKIIEIDFCPSAEMVADSLTKAVSKEKTNFCTSSMGLESS